jgi:hypothetical protein
LSRGHFIFYLSYRLLEKIFAIGTSFASGKEIPVLLQNTVHPKLVRNEAGKMISNGHRTWPNWKTGQFNYDDTQDMKEWSNPEAVELPAHAEPAAQRVVVRPPAHARHDRGSHD